MKEEEINKRIAEACGWTEIQESTAPKEFRRKQTGTFQDKFGNKLDLHQIPDYCTDLNAMHEAEKVLDYEQCEAFSNTVADIVHAVNGKMDYRFPWHFARIHASARQRAEAFLKTIRKWEEAVVKESFTTEEETK